MHNQIAMNQTILLLLVIAFPVVMADLFLDRLTKFLSQEYLFNSVALGNYNISSNWPTKCEKIKDNHYSVKMEAKAVISELGKGGTKVTVEFYVFVCTILDLMHDNGQRDEFAIYYVGDLHCPQYHLRHKMLRSKDVITNSGIQIPEVSVVHSKIPECKLMENRNLVEKIQAGWKYEALETLTVKSKKEKYTVSSYEISKSGEKPEYFWAISKGSRISKNSTKIFPYEMNFPETQISKKYCLDPYIPEWTSHTPGTEDSTTLAALLYLFTNRFGKPSLLNIITKTRMPAISKYSEIWVLEIEYENDKKIVKHCFVATLPKDIEELPPILGEPVVGQNQALVGGNYAANAIVNFDQKSTYLDPEVKAEINSSINNLLLIRFGDPGLSFEYGFTGISGNLSGNKSPSEFVWIFELRKAPSDSTRANYFGVRLTLCKKTQKLAAVAIGHFCRSIVTIYSTQRRNFFSRGLKGVESLGAKLIFSPEEPSKGLVGHYLKELKKNTGSTWLGCNSSVQRRFPTANFASVPHCSCYGKLLANIPEKLSEFIVFEVSQKDIKKKMYFIMRFTPSQVKKKVYERTLDPNVFRTSEEAEDYASEFWLPTAPTIENV